MEDNKQSSSVYFAAKPPEELAGELSKKVESFVNETITSGLKARWLKSWRYYYNRYFADNLGSVSVGATDIKMLGEQGELSAVSLNHYRNLIQHILVLTTSIRPAIDVLATNSDSKSQKQAKLGGQLIDYYMREKELEKYFIKACEHALVFGSGYVKVVWDVTAGKEYGVDGETEQLKMEGDLKFSNPSVYDIVYDTYKENYEDNDWIVERSFRNKYDLVALYPELAEKILNLPSKAEKYPTQMKDVAPSSNDVEVFEFYHRKTQSMPKGRYMFFCDRDTVMIDSDLPYRDIPIYQINPATILGTQYGYSSAFDLAGPQEFLNTLVSTMLTNVNAHGVQNISVAKGSDVSIVSLTGGLNVVEYDPQYAPPAALDLLQINPALFNLAPYVEKQMETLSGVNSVARGNPDESLKSGTALAFVQAQAIQYASGLQNSYNRLIEQVATSALRMLRDFASTTRVISIAGKNNRFRMRDFSGDDLENINRVACQQANPLTKTLSGRLELANNMINQGLLSNPQEYLTVIETGQVQPLTQSESNELDLIHDENEAILEGTGLVKAVITDNHVQHIKEHKLTLGSVEARQDPQLMQRALSHIMEHITLMAQADPAVMSVLGYASLQAPPPPPGTPGSPTPPPEAMNGPLPTQPKAAKQPNPPKPQG